MRIYTDNLLSVEIHKLAGESLPSDVYLDLTEHGSRKRARAFEVKLSAEPGTDRHGHNRRWANSGQYGAAGDKAATWFEWGDFFASIFAADPRAVIGPYDGVREFLYITAQDDPTQRDIPEGERVSFWHGQLAPRLPLEDA